MAALARRALAEGRNSIKPGDSETRTFLHDLPVVQGLSARGIAEALSRRKGCVVLDEAGALMAASGSVSPEQPFVTASSMAFACFTAFFAGHLRLLRQGRADAAALDEFAAVRALEARDHARLPGTLPELLAGPFAGEAQARAAMVQAGRAVVEYGLVDSSFGNVSCRQAAAGGELLLISQTGSSLDELSDCIDPCRMDEGSCAGLTASSEYTAHKAIYDQDPAAGLRTILHGHPRFAVALSMDCDVSGCPEEGECHRACKRPRSLFAGRHDLPEVPIVPGEVGTGPFGLCNTLPAALAGKGDGGAAMVHGHGLFAVGAQDFRSPFAALFDIERASRAEYYRRVEALHQLLR